MVNYYAEQRKAFGWIDKQLDNVKLQGEPVMVESLLLKAGSLFAYSERGMARRVSRIVLSSPELYLEDGEVKRHE